MTSYVSFKKGNLEWILDHGRFCKSSKLARRPEDSNTWITFQYREITKEVWWVTLIPSLNTKTLFLANIDKTLACLNLNSFIPIIIYNLLLIGVKMMCPILPIDIAGGQSINKDFFTYN